MDKMLLDMIGLAVTAGATLLLGGFTIWWVDHEEYKKISKSREMY